MGNTTITWRQIGMHNYLHEVLDKCWFNFIIIGLEAVLLKKEVSLKAKLSIYQSIFVPTLTSGHDELHKCSGVERMKRHEGSKGFYFCNRVIYSNKNIHRAAAATINIPDHTPPPPAGSSFFTAAVRDEFSQSENLHKVKDLSTVFYFIYLTGG